MFDLGFEQQRHLPGDQREEGFERSGSDDSTDAQAGESCPSRAGRFATGLAQMPVRIGIMEYDQPVVGGEPEIAFDPGAKIDRRTECGSVFSGTAEPKCSPRWAKPRGPGSRGSGPDGDDRIHFDRDSKRQNGNSDGAARVAAGLAEHVLHQFRRAIGDFRLVGEARARC